MCRLSLLIFSALSWGAIALAGPKLEEIPSYALGIDALSGSLWDVAASRFEDSLKTPDLDPPVRQALLLRLAEARIRGDQVEAAEETLADPALAEHPEVPFWKGQALVKSGRFNEAIELFQEQAIGPKAPHRREALLTTAELQRAIGDSKGSLETIDILLKTNPDSARARLLKARLLIDDGQPAGALKVLPQGTKLKGAEAKKADLLRAQALLESEQYEDAATIFNALIEDPKDQSLERHHTAFLGLARARIASDNTVAAADGLLAFIQQNPESPLLDDAFGLLMECLPEQPTPNDVILTRLREWVPKPRLTSSAIPTSSERSAASYPFIDPEQNPLAPAAMFHLALGLRMENSGDSRLEARRLLLRLRLEYPDHPLVARALLEGGRWDLLDDRRQQAAAHFAALESLQGAPPELRAQGLILEGNARSKEQDFEGAEEVNRKAASLLEDEQRETALLNAATALLAGGNAGGFEELAGEVDSPELTSDLNLERGLFLTSERDPAAASTLRAFIATYPDHPRMAEARLHAALATLQDQPPDIDFAREQLAALSDEERDTLPPGMLTMAEIRLHDRAGEWAEAADRAKRFLEGYADDPIRQLVLFEQGKALFQNKDYNDARLVMEKLALDFPDSPQAPAALLLSARAAAEGATPQSQTESIALFDKLIESDSPFADVARIEKADMLIRRLSRVDDAVKVLDPWFKQMEKDDPLLLSVGLMLGKALYASAETDSAKLVQALEVYDRLLADLPEDSPSRSRILHQKGLTLEQLEGRESDALICYMDVIQNAGDDPRTDWKSVDNCGFSALRILEKREQWRAARKLASDIAKLNGPRAKEAEDRAKDIGLKHMIWDE
ncbi:MAG: tetratricopeptide repeat protein [Verrucomicrobiota bacterium]